MMELTRKKIKLSNGETLAYLDLGEGEETLLLIHGNVSSSVHYMPLIERLPRTLRVVAVDLRGFGESSYNKPFNHLYELTEDVSLFIKALKLPKAAVAGWSAGGGVALALAARHPEQVKKLILINSMSYKGLPIFRKGPDGSFLIGQTYASKEELGLDKIQVVPVLNAIKDKNMAVMKYIWNAAIYNVSKPAEPEFDLYMNESFKQRCLVDLDWALTRFNMGVGVSFGVEGDKSIADVKVPVLSLYGRNDKTVPEYMIRETVGALAKKARLIIYEKCGHAPLVDVPDQLSKDILGFIYS